MAATSGWWPSVNGDRKYYIEQQANVFAQIYSNGVLPVGSQLQVLSVTGFQVKVTPGFAWINGYWIYNNADYNLTLDAPDGVLGRIDRIVLQWNRINRAVNLCIKKGAASATPSGTVLQRDADKYELCLAEIAVPAGVTSVTQVDITDTRPDSSLCGFSAVYDPPDSSAWFAQFETSFEEWFASVQTLLDDDVAGHLANQIIALQTHTKNVRCEIANKEITVPVSAWTENAAAMRKEAIITDALIRADTDIDLTLADDQKGNYSIGALNPVAGSVTIYSDSVPGEALVIVLSITEVRASA